MNVRNKYAICKLSELLCGEIRLIKVRFVRTVMIFNINTNDSNM